MNCKICQEYIGRPMVEYIPCSCKTGLKDVTNDVKNMRLALRNLRHLYEQMLRGLVTNQESGAKGLLGPAIEIIEKEIGNG